MPNMKREEWAQAAEHLEEIREGIEELLADAEMTLDECDCGIVARRAKAYWLAHIADALGTEDAGVPSVSRYLPLLGRF